MIKKFIVILVVVVGIAGALLKWEDNRERDKAAAQAAAAAARARAQAVTHVNVPHSDALNYNPFATPGTSAKSK
jgi:Na+-transporting methylmalonyl-CoA/oxaloacetate decarboxylase gamma subunit